MSSFTTPLFLEYLDGRRWRVVQAFTYYVGELGTGEPITVPADFVTDFASVPRLFWRLLPPTGMYGKAAVIHDYLYQTQDRSRADADRIFIEAMEVLGVSRVTRQAMYRAVRLCGWYPWQRYAQERNAA
jgi:hypothetical protein